MAGLLTAAAFDAMDRGRDDLIDDLWLDLAEENRESFRCFLRMLGSPAVGWFGWINLCWSGSRISLPDSIVIEPECRPTYEDQVDISPVAEAEWAGFELGCNGLAVVGPVHYTSEEQAAFLRGHAAGLKAYEEAEGWEIERDSRVDGADSPEIHQAELVEGAGIFAARMGA